MHRLKYLLIISLFSISVQAETKSLVSTSHSTINFGYVPQMGEYSRKITIKSNISDTLRIGKIKTYCDCITANINNDIIYPGDSIILELRLRSNNIVGRQYKVTHIYDENNIRLAKITVRASVYKKNANFETIFVEPAILNFSQFGDKGIDEAIFNISNISDETVPLELMFTYPEYFELDFPVYVESNKKAKGTVKLTKKGKSCEFGESFTFKFIDAKSQEYLFSVPVKRKVFTGKTDSK